MEFKCFVSCFVVSCCALVRETVEAAVVEFALDEGRLPSEPTDVAMDGPRRDPLATRAAAVSPVAAGFAEGRNAPGDEEAPNAKVLRPGVGE